MISLAIAYLRDRPLTTALNVLLLAISVAMLVLLLQLGTQANQRFSRDAQGVDLVVGAKGSPLQLILSSVFHVDAPTGNVPYSSLDLLRRDPAVARVVPLALGDNFQGFRIVGTDESFADLYQTQIAKGRAFSGPMEAVLGASVAADTGADLGQKFVGSHGLQDDEASDQGHNHAPFETVGILEPTGTVVDRLILTSYRTTWDVHGIDHDHEDHGNHGHDEEHEGHTDHADHADHADHGADKDEDHDHHGDHHAHDEKDSDHGDAAEASPQRQERAILQARGNGLEPELTALLVSYRNSSGAIRIPAMINRQTQMQSAIPAAQTARLLELLGASVDGIRVFAWLMAITGGLAILVALLNMARSRENDLALLRVMGASRVQVFATIIMEGVITAALGAGLGWVLAHSLLMGARANFSTLANLGLQPWQPVAAEALLVAAVLGIGALAALIPALRVYRIDPAKILARP